MFLLAAEPGTSVAEAFAEAIPQQLLACH